MANEFCLNCGTKLAGEYCHQCGQKDLPRRQALGDLFSNIISSFTNYEGKFFQTAKYLFLKPGFLAVEYNKGRREHYFHPVRLYVFVSAIFFLMFVLLPDTKSGIFEAGLSEKEKSDIQWKLKDPLYQTPEQYDSAQRVAPESKRHGWFERMLQKRSFELREKYGDDDDAMIKDILANFSENFSTVLFYLMPLMALLLKLLYIRRGYYYSEHLALTLNYYNFFFVGGTLIMFLNLVSWLSFLSAVIGFWIFFYLLFAMKRMYDQGWVKTILKFGIFTFLFSILIVLGVLINGLVSIMSI